MVLCRGVRFFSEDERVNGSLLRMVDTSPALQGAGLNRVVESPKPGPL